MSQPEIRLSLTLEGTVAPSEDPAKVKEAMANVLGDCRHSIEQDASRIKVSSDDARCIRRLRDQLRDRHVRSAARKLLYAGREGKRSTVMLNRQAARAGVLVLCGSEAESPLGPLFLTIRSDDLDAVIESLTAYEGG